MADAAGLVLGMDVGTSSLRTALFSMSGQRQPGTTAQHTYALRDRPSGAAELDPARLLRAALAALTETLARHAADPALRARPILAWGTSGFWHSLLGTDAEGRPLTPIFTWADSRAASDAARLRETLEERAVHTRTGCMVRASFWPAKLAWLRRTRPGLFARVAHWVSPADWVLASLGDASARPGRSALSGTGLIDWTRGGWDRELLRALALSPERLPRLPEVGSSPPGPWRLGARWERRFPALRGAAIFPAIGDGAAGNLGCGLGEPGHGKRRFAAVNFGTSAAVRLTRAGAYRPAPFGLFCYALDDGDRWLVGGATANAGNARAWAREAFGLTEAEADRTPAGLATRPPAAPLLALSHLHGERAPTWRDDLAGAIVGLRADHRAGDLFRAVVEGTYLRLGRIVDALAAAEEDAGGGDLRLVVSGGLTRSPASVRWLCDALGRPCHVSAEHEASLRGAAVYALRRLGRRAEPAGREPAIRSRPAWARHYATLRKRQAKLEETLTNGW